MRSLTIETLPVHAHERLRSPLKVTLCNIDRTCSQPVAENGNYLHQDSPMLRPIHTMRNVLLSATMIGLIFRMGEVNTRRSLEEKLRHTEEVQSALFATQTRLLSERVQLDPLYRVNRDLLETIDELQQKLRDRDSVKEKEEKQVMPLEQEFLLVQDQLGWSWQATNRHHQHDLVRLITTAAYDRFGTEHRDVEFQVIIRESNADFEGEFVVELAAFEEMPISTLLFLQQVDHGLWDHSQITSNNWQALVVKAASSYEMEVLGMARRPTSEHSKSLLRGEYSLCFGREADKFVISNIDNFYTRARHACFGRVVEGFRVVERIISHQAKSNEILLDPIEIVSIKILEYDQEPEETES